ncbi:MAG: hypothetical protein EBS63_04450, partial [Burkholderiaceae bacterium]|nr:hypothetical protein [Burkholderiaceae bacterium]
FLAAGFFAADFFLAIAIVILLHVRIRTNYCLRKPDHYSVEHLAVPYRKRASYSSARGLKLAAAR